jgi:16S rRNA (uracil1498-N3)-methyltransferase
MRAIYHENIENLSYIEGEEAHHLANVVRIKKGEEILILNGKGQRVRAKVSNIEKDRVYIEIFESILMEHPNRIHLAIGLPKKDAFEEVIRNATEIGLSKIYYFKSQFSQQDFVFNDRIKRVLISASIQSNNPYFPALEKLADLNSLISIFGQYNKILYFCSHSKIPSKSDLNLNERDKVLVIIGPEGGFSSPEEDQLINNSLVNAIHLPSYILRAQNAVVASTAWIMGKLE